MSQTNKPLHLVGVTSCLGAQDQGCHTGPIAVRHAGIEAALNDGQTQWHTVAHNCPLVTPDNTSDIIYNICEQLAERSEEFVSNTEPFLVIGGDHSCGIGTWSGVKRSLADEPLGLIWIDAHMDSHLPETSPSAALHGMPLACLLGHGEARFCNLAGQRPVLQPQHVCLIGIRSYEPEEKALLALLGVKVFYMNDVRNRGLEEVFSQALIIAKGSGNRFGISIDLDAIDPTFAPGVGSPEADGIDPAELTQILATVKNEPNFIGLEIAELNPANDIEHKTAQLCIDLAKAIY